MLQVLLLKALIAYSKMLEEKSELRKELSGKKEPVLYNLRGSLPIHIAKEAKIRKFTVEEACSGGKHMSVAGQHFLENIRCVTQFPINHLSRSQDWR